MVTNHINIIIITKRGHSGAARYEETVAVDSKYCSEDHKHSAKQTCLYLSSLRKFLCLQRPPFPLNLSVFRTSKDRWR